MSGPRGGGQAIPRPPTWEPGGAAPWSSIETNLLRPNAALVRSRLGDAPDGQPWPGPLGDRRPSAVLAALYDDADGLATVILTRRASTLRSHRGEVSFPGGRLEVDETPLDAALRETHEEVGLQPSAVEIVGELDHLATYTSGSHIVPYVGVLSDRPQLVAEPGEVEHIIEVTLADLYHPDTFREEFWDFGTGELRPMTFFEFPGDTVWGATARMLRQLLSTIVGVAPGDELSPEVGPGRAL